MIKRTPSLMEYDYLFPLSACVFMHFTIDLIKYHHTNWRLLCFSLKSSHSKLTLFLGKKNRFNEASLKRLVHNLGHIFSAFCFWHAFGRFCSCNYPLLTFNCLLKIIVSNMHQLGISLFHLSVGAHLLIA